MKKIFLLLSLVLTLNVLSAQHFSIKYIENGTDYTNDEMTIVENPAVATLGLHFNIINETSNSMKLGIRKTIVYADEKFEAYFCTAGGCYTPSTMELPAIDRPTIAPGGELTFDADFDAYDIDEEWNFIPVVGSIKVIYEIYSDEYSDIATLTLTFNNGTNSIISFDKQYETSVYPNPVMNVANFNYQLPEGVANATLNVFSCVGNKVKEMILPANENKISLSVSDLSSGVYIYSININGRIIATNKFVVK